MTDPNYYIGKVKEVLDPKIYIISVEVPGIFTELKAFPKKGQMDEPKPGDPVLLLGLDPIYDSYYLWEGLKETEFRGIRVAGKEITWTEDKVTIGVYGGENTEDGEEPEPDIASVVLDKDGNITIAGKGNGKVEISKNLEITVSGSANIKISGNADVLVGKNTTLQSMKTTIKGPGILKCSGTVVPGSGGPFVATPITPTPGTPFPTGDTIMLT